VPALTVPLSSYMSVQARDAFVALFRDAPPGPGENASPRVLRAYDDRQNAPYVRRAEELWPVTIESRVIGGVRTRIITPKSGVAAVNKDRVLINLHGGAFIWGEGNGALAESIPIAGVAGIRVVTVDYREAPEYRFPAASEDVAAVYRALLKHYRPANIGIYGSSAGGILTAESIAWFQRENLPLPGAIGTFSGSADALGGDAAYLGPVLIGQAPMPVRDVGTLNFTPYFTGASPSDPLVLPVRSAEVLSRFPPTLLIGGSRDFTVSSLYRVQAALSDAGVDAELHVWDGMWHVFFFDPNLPESRQVYRVVAKFFERHLGR
jgi:monoterpene epsilon-lactone hydrolase